MLRRCTPMRILHHLARTFFTIQKGSKRIMAGTSLGYLVGLTDEGEGNKQGCHSSLCRRVKKNIL